MLATLAGQLEKLVSNSHNSYSTNAGLGKGKGVLSPEDRARRYALTALAGEVARVEGAGENERGNTLYSSTKRAAQFIPCGALSESEVSESMTRAGEGVGLSSSNVVSTVQRAIKNGKDDPWSPDSVLEIRTRGRVRRRRNGKVQHRELRTVTPSPAKLKRPPQHEVLALWEAAAPTDLTWAPAPDWYLDGVSYLIKRLWHPPAVAALDLARILPGEYSWPKWWPWGDRRIWSLAMLTYEADGTPASIQARAIELRGEGADPKSRNPKGYSAAELLFADSKGLALLKGEGAPPKTILLAEGLTDTLALALWARYRAEPAAVLGMVAGSAKALSRVAWRPGQTVVCFTDTDGAGEGYAQAALAALPEFVTMLRAEVGHE